MPRNTLGDLNNHLFEQLERLNDEELTPDQLEMEMNRSSAMREVANSIIQNANLALKAEKLKIEYGGKQVQLPRMLEHRDG